MCPGDQLLDTRVRGAAGCLGDLRHLGKERGFHRLFYGAARGRAGGLHLRILLRGDLLLGQLGPVVVGAWCTLQERQRRQSPLAGFGSGALHAPAMHGQRPCERLDR